jgi:hypothetical protein
MGFTVTGMIVLCVSGKEGDHNLRFYGLPYSFDMFLPIISPLKHHYDISLTGWAEAYFYVHRFFGLVLTSVLIASIPEWLLPKG